MGTPTSADHDVLEKAFGAEGVSFLGVASVEGSDGGASDRYRRWLAAGGHGTMAFLARHEDGKYNPEFSLPGTRSVLVAGLSYAQPRPGTGLGGLVARYAWGRDYHKVLLAKLKRVAESLAALWPGERWRSFTDTAPLDERWWAERAGASFTARNALSIHRKLGSWFVLGEILTTRNVPATGPRAHAHGGCPSGCRRCHDVCPTGALSPEGRMDATKCISYLTIEHRGPIPDALKPKLGAWVFGCDLCQEVCPFNLAAPSTAEPEFLAWKAGPDLELGAVLSLDERAFTQRFAGSPVHRAGRAGLVRNACLAAANTRRHDLVTLVAGLKSDADEGVADAARWALSCLSAEAQA